MIMHPHIKLSLMKQATPTWRTISVPDTLTLEQFSHVINLCFGWPDTSIYAFIGEQSTARFTNSEQHNLSDFKNCCSVTNATVLDLLREQEPLVYAYGSCPSLKIEISLDSFPRLLYHPKLQIIETFGDNIPCQDGSYIPFQQQTIMQRLQTLQNKLVQEYEAECPSDIFLLQKKLLEDGLLDDFIDNVKEDFQLEDISDHILEIMIDGLEEDLGQSLSKTYTLHQCLWTLNKEELTNLARFHRLSGYSKLRKEELINYLETALQQPNILENCFSKLTYPDIELLGTLCNYNIPMIHYDSFLSMRYLITAGICYRNNTGTAFTLPIEFRETFHNLLQSDSWQATVYLNDIVHSHCFTAVYLYGIYPITALLPNIETMFGTELDISSLMPTIKMLAEGRKEYICRAGFIQDMSFANNNNSYELYRHQQQMNDYYYPDDQAINQIYWDKWLINQKLYDSFQDTFEDYYRDENTDFQFFMRQLEYNIRSGKPFAILIQQLTEQKFVLPNKKITEQFIVALQQIWNHTPIWGSCGYSLTQMSQKQKNNVISLKNYQKTKNRN